MTKTESILIAKWESRSGKYYAELFHDGESAFYCGDDCGGNLGLMSKESAITTLQARVDSGYFLPDAAKTPMKRTF